MAYCILGLIYIYVSWKHNVISPTSTTGSWAGRLIINGDTITGICTQCMCSQWWIYNSIIHVKRYGLLHFTPEKCKTMHLLSEWCSFSQLYGYLCKHTLYLQCLISHDIEWNPRGSERYIHVGAVLCNQIRIYMYIKCVCGGGTYTCTLYM